MECVFTFTVVLIAFLFLLLNNKRATRKGQLNAFFRRLAARLHGSYTAAGMWHKYPTTRFRYGPTRVAVRVVRGLKSREEITELTISWPDSDYRLDIFPDTALAPPSSATAPFESEFVIRSNAEAETRRLLTPPVQGLIRVLRSMGAQPGLRISISGGRQLVQKPGNISSYEYLERLVRLTLDLFDQSMLTRAEGIEFVAETIEWTSEIICQICGEQIIHDIVYCRQCRTPHHLDCWQYYGACSTYGCQQTDYLPADDHHPQA